MDFGVVEVSDGIPSHHHLVDGRDCVMTPTILKDGNVKLVTSFGDTNVSGARHSYSLTMDDIPTDRAMSFMLDKDDLINVKLHILK